MSGSNGPALGSAFTRFQRPNGGALSAPLIPAASPTAAANGTGRLLHSRGGPGQKSLLYNSRRKSSDHSQQKELRAGSLCAMMRGGVRIPVVLALFVCGLTALALFQLLLDFSTTGALAKPPSGRTDADSMASAAELLLQQEREALGVGSKMRGVARSSSAGTSSIERLRAAEQLELAERSARGDEVDDDGVAPGDEERESDLEQDIDESDDSDNIDPEADPATDNSDDENDESENADDDLEEPASQPAPRQQQQQQGRALVPVAQLQSKIAKSFTYFRGACTSYCRELKKAGYKQLPGLAVPARPEFLIISYKSLTKYHSTSNTILNQIGYGSACIGGGKGKQLSCKEDIARAHGCEYRTLGVQPAQWNIKLADDCRAFFAEARKPSQAKQIWIVKPGGSFHGAGIKLYEGVAELERLYPCERPVADGLIVQRYLAQPALFSGYKFDFRTYMLVASMDPYVIMYHEGFVRRSEHQYDTSASGLGDTKKHITNSKSQSLTDHFFSFAALQERLTAESGFAPDFMERVFRPHAMRTTNFIFYAARQKFTHRRTRFQVFALDWMLDGKGGMHLLEANGNPQIGNYPGLDDLTPAVWVSMHDAVHMVQAAPEELPADFTVRAKYRHRGWRLVHNELEVQASGEEYNACKFDEYAKTRHPLFSFE